MTRRLCRLAIMREEGSAQADLRVVALWKKRARIFARRAASSSINRRPAVDDAKCVDAKFKTLIM
jgi:hypothetical protein